MNSDVGILTFYYADNYGAVLQCYALQKKSEELGKKTSIINYKPIQMISWKSKIQQLFFPTVQQRLFRMFRKRFLNVNCLKKNFHIVLVGSDQVWNPEIIKNDGKWISPTLKYKYISAYAASIGKELLGEEEKTFFTQRKEELRKYKYVTVREESGKKILNGIGITCDVVCDPTLLFYNDIRLYTSLAELSNVRSKVNIKEKYVIVYSLEHSDDIDNIINMVKNDMNIKVIGIHPYNCKTQRCDQFISDTSPIDFLYLLKNSTAIITNSFHGLAFSFIFRKKVYNVIHHKFGSRQIELIKKSGFQYETINENSVYLDTDQITEIFNDYIEYSENYLKKMLMCQ